MFIVFDRRIRHCIQSLKWGESGAYYCCAHNKKEICEVVCLSVLKKSEKIRVSCKVSSETSLKNSCGIKERGVCVSERENQKIERREGERKKKRGRETIRKNKIQIRLSVLTSGWTFYSIWPEEVLTDELKKILVQSCTKPRYLTSSICPPQTLNAFWRKWSNCFTLPMS